MLDKSKCICDLFQQVNMLYLLIQLQSLQLTNSITCRQLRCMQVRNSLLA